MFNTGPAFFMHPSIRSVAIALTAFFAVATFAEAMEMTSTYTKLDGPDCAQKAPPKTGENEYSLEEGTLVCNGPKGFTATIHAYDGRSFMQFGDDFGEGEMLGRTFMSFDMPGPAMEWRLHDGVPVAMILRFKIGGLSAPGVKDGRGNVLVIHRLPGLGGPACHVAWVDAIANKNANEMAREVADAAPSFRCGTDKPHTFGEVTPIVAFEAESLGLDRL
ncbi:MAG: hypothetical protein AAF764_10150 [Pseudomonadota bacterium]